MITPPQNKHANFDSSLTLIQTKDISLSTTKISIKYIVPLSKSIYLTLEIQHRVWLFESLHLVSMKDTFNT